MTTDSLEYSWRSVRSSISAAFDTAAWRCRQATNELNYHISILLSKMIKSQGTPLFVLWTPSETSIRQDGDLH
jgi:hypothetical protein